MQLQRQFEDSEIERIVDEALIYQCACPAQVAEILRKLREVFSYQQDCMGLRSEDLGVHARILDSVARAHAELETCLDDVLRIENWDRKELKMPENLRARTMKEVLGK